MEIDETYENVGDGGYGDRSSERLTVESIDRQVRGSKEGLRRKRLGRGDTSHTTERIFESSQGLFAR